MKPAGMRRWPASLIASLFAASCGQSEPVTGATSVVPSVVASAEAALSEAATLAASCSGCHHRAGQALVSLEGRDAAAITALLLAYKHEDGMTVMHRIARGYGDADLAAIAAVLAGDAADTAP